MPVTAVVLGGALSVWEEEAQACAIFGGEPDLIVGVNHAAKDRPGRLDAWASFHVELFPMWIAERKLAGRPDAGSIWTAVRRAAPKGMEHVKRAPNWGGSSGLLGVTVALELGAERVILCGVPLTREGEHYDKPGVWSDAGNYRRGWMMHVPQMGGRVRSLGGWTRELLGAPDEDWINGAGIVPQPPLRKGDDELRLRAARRAP